MDIYSLSRNFWDFSFEHPEEVRPIHSALFFFAVDHCNRLGWKERFGLPTTMAKEAIGVASYNTYVKAFDDLQKWGFFTVIQKSTNQFTSNIIALSNSDKATNKALDKATTKLITKQSESTGESNDQSTGKSIDSINRQITNLHITNIVEPTRCDIELIYTAYPSKCPVKGSSTGKSEKHKEIIAILLKTQSKAELLAKINRYKSDCVKDSRFMKNFGTFLNQLPDYSDSNTDGQSKNIDFYKSLFPFDQITERTTDILDRRISEFQGLYGINLTEYDIELAKMLDVPFEGLKGAIDSGHLNHRP